MRAIVTVTPSWTDLKPETRSALISLAKAAARQLENDREEGTPTMTRLPPNALLPPP